LAGRGWGSEGWTIKKIWELPYNFKHYIYLLFIECIFTLIIIAFIYDMAKKRLFIDEIFDMLILIE